MTTLVAATPVQDSDTAERWQKWRARGLDADQRRAAWLRKLAVLVVVALTIWFTVPLG